MNNFPIDIKETDLWQLFQLSKEYHVVWNEEN